MTERKSMPIYMAALPLVIMIVAMGFTIIKYEGALLIFPYY
ncbi:hypothetical protein [Halobacillus alkaliphilus]|nr:hypothetical protein [Halobacillus alkaliphilus]